MRKAFSGILVAAAGFTALAASVEPASAWRSYRWYRDYAPYYGPPVVYVVPPAYAYYPPAYDTYAPPAVAEPYAPPPGVAEGDYSSAEGDYADYPPGDGGYPPPDGY